MIDPNDVIRSREFHGHMCPGLAIGIRAAEVALSRVGPHAKDEEVVAVVETDMCAVDAIQVLTGCTFGKGNLLHKDYGKNAFTFISRARDEAVRLVTQPLDFGAPSELDAQVIARVRAGGASDEDSQRFWALQQDRADRILTMPLDEIFAISTVEPQVPARARIHDSVMCAGCGERTMETRARMFRGELFCRPCFLERDRR